MQGTGNGALSRGASELCALGALSAELIFAQVITKKFGRSFLIHARADSCTARALATKQRSKPENGTHSHAIHLRSGFGLSETADDVRNSDRCESERHRDESIGT